MNIYQQERVNCVLKRAKNLNNQVVNIHIKELEKLGKKATLNCLEYKNLSHIVDVYDKTGEILEMETKKKEEQKKQEVNSESTKKERYYDAHNIIYYEDGWIHRGNLYSSDPAARKRYKDPADAQEAYDKRIK